MDATRKLIPFAIKFRKIPKVRLTVIFVANLGRGD